MKQRRKKTFQESEYLFSKNAKSFGLKEQVGTVICLLLSLYTAKGAFKTPYVDLGTIFIALLFLLPILYWLQTRFNTPQLQMSIKGIVVKNRFRKQIFLRANILGFTTNKYKNKYFIGEKVILKTDHGFLTIDSNTYSNFYAFKRLIAKRYQRLNRDNFKTYFFKKSLPTRILFIGLGLLCLCLTFSNEPLQLYELEQSLAFTELTLSQSPQKERTGGKRSKDYIKFSIQEYPQFSFTMEGDAYDACNKAVFKDLKKGDKVQISIPRIALDSKLLRTIEPSFTTKHFSWSRIPVYNIKKEGAAYVDLIKFKRWYESRGGVSWILVGLGSIFLLCGLFLPNKQLR